MKHKIIGQIPPYSPLNDWDSQTFTAITHNRKMRLISSRTMTNAPDTIPCARHSHLSAQHLALSTHNKKHVALLLNSAHVLFFHIHISLNLCH